MGEVDESNPLVIELINSKAMQRLKAIDQSGPEAYYTKNFPCFSRYDHSLGVYALLKRYNVSDKEQIAGLLHDTSHTVFSHLGDIVFQNSNNVQEAYQDNIHNWYLTKAGIADILAKYQIKIEDVSPKNSEFTALEQPFPDMNADRIEYNLHTALVFKNLDQEDVAKILAALKYENRKWYFTDITNAKKFATLSTYYTKAFWGNAHNVALYAVAATAVKYALAKNIISKDEMHFGIDKNVVDKLNTTEDTTIIALIKIMRDINNYFVHCDAKSADIIQKIKMRGIDPLVMQDGKLHRLSQLSMDFKNELQLTQMYAMTGVTIKFINIDPKLLNLISH
jgi:HD superfamily phosphohydrolase